MYSTLLLMLAALVVIAVVGALLTSRMGQSPYFPNYEKNHCYHP